MFVQSINITENKLNQVKILLKHNSLPKRKNCPFLNESTKDPG